MNHAGGGLAQEIPVPENEQRLSVLRGHGAALEIAQRSAGSVRHLHGQHIRL